MKYTLYIPTCPSFYLYLNSASAYLRPPSMHALSVCMQAVLEAHAHAAADAVDAAADAALAAADAEQAAEQAGGHIATRVRQTFTAWFGK